MDWMLGQGDLIAALARVTLEEVPQAGIPRTELFISMSNKTGVDGFNHVLGTLTTLGALQLAPNPATRFYVTRGLHYGKVLGRLRATTRGIYEVTKAIAQYPTE